MISVCYNVFPFVSLTSVYFSPCNYSSKFDTLPFPLSLNNNESNIPRSSNNNKNCATAKNNIILPHLTKIIIQLAFFPEIIQLPMHKLIIPTRSYYMMIPVMGQCGPTSPLYADGGAPACRTLR